MSARKAKSNDRLRHREGSSMTAAERCCVFCERKIETVPQSCARRHPDGAAVHYYCTDVKGERCPKLVNGLPCSLGKGHRQPCRVDAVTVAAMIVDRMDRLRQTVAQSPRWEELLPWFIVRSRKGQNYTEKVRMYRRMPAAELRNGAKEAKR